MYAPAHIYAHIHQPLMEDNQKILSFASIDVTEYLNKTHRTADHFLIETQKHNLEKYQKELNDYLHLSFVANCDSLLAILDTYKYCHEHLQTCRIPKLMQNEAAASINEPQSKEFAKRCKKFVDDVEPFITKERFLVADAFFNDGKHYCVLTNDLIFIGEQEKHGERYVLRNAISKNIVEMERTDKALTITATGGVSYVLREKKEALDAFYDAFQEAVYEYRGEDRAEAVSAVVDEELIEYYLETEQIGALKEYLDGLECPTPIRLQALDGLRITGPEDLKIAMQISKEPSAVFSRFALERFRHGLGALNKIQRVHGLVGDVFDCLEDFAEQLAGIAEKTGLPQMDYVLCVEQLVQAAFDTVDRRIFNKFYEITITEENMELIKSRLRFKGLDFRYLINRLEDRRKAFAGACVENAKKEIGERLGMLFK